LARRAGFKPPIPVGEARLNLTTRPFLAQDDRATAATAIVADHMERVLADVDADHGAIRALAVLGI